MPNPTTFTPLGSFVPRILDKVARIAALGVLLLILPLICAGCFSLFIYPFVLLDVGLTVAGFLFWAVYAVILFVTGRAFFPRIFPKKETAEYVSSGRIAGFFKGFLIGGAVLILYGAGKRFLMDEGAIVSFTATLCVIFGCAVVGAFFPLKEEPRRRGWLVWAVGVVTLFIVLWIGLIALMDLAFGGRKVDTVYPNYTAYMEEVGKDWADRSIPQQATQVTVRGGYGGLFPSLQWSCLVGEDDFLAFAQANRYALAENDDTHNTNPETNQIRYSRGHPFGGKELPTSYYYYSFVFTNCGGWFLLYDRTTQTLYGAYHSH